MQQYINHKEGLFKEWFLFLLQGYICKLIWQDVNNRTWKHRIYDTTLKSTTDMISNRVFFSDEAYCKCQKKKKKALIGVLTLGMASITLVGIKNTWDSNLFRGTSMDKGGTGFVLRIISFLFCLTLLSIPYFFYSVIALIYYSVQLQRIKDSTI